MLAWVTPVSAADIPPLPHAFYGTLKINNNDAPVGTTVEARGQGVTTGIDGNPITTTEVGKYGNASPLGAKLVVQGFITDGATLNFYVNGVAAAQTAAWHSGATTQLNLTVTITTAPPTVTSNAATAIGTTTATLNGSLTNRGTASSVQVSFEWGLTSAYGNQTTPQTMTSTGSFGAPLSGLSPSTTYHFQAKAVGEGTGYGTDRTFTTGTPAQPGAGAPGVGDTTPPTISDILLSIITKTSADISWKTNETSDSQVEYWSSPSKLSPLDTAMVINHLVHLTDLTPGTTYHYKTMSRDAAANLAVSGEYTFTTLPGAAAFAASKVSISPSEVYIEETVTISVLITNTGDGAGSYGVSLKIDGKVEATKDITLNPGASGEVTFTTTKDVAGTYSVDVNGLTGSFIVKEKVVPLAPAPPPTPAPAPAPAPAPTPAPAPAPLPPPTPAPAPVNWVLIAAIAVATIVVVGAVVWYLSFRRRY
jgi:hypothetical protein